MPDPQPLATGVTTEHLRAAVDAAVGPVRTELRWQRYVVGLLAMAVISPKLGGPSAPAIAAIVADPGAAAHLLGLVRLHLGR